MSAFPLKPCPFCGGEARLFSASLPMLADCADIQVSCEQCDAIGPGILFDQTEHGESDIPELERESREAWNARAALSPNMDHAVGGEEAAWDWLDSKFLNVEAGHHPNDRAYSADEMVDAFMAGLGRSTPPVNRDAVREALREKIANILQPGRNAFFKGEATLTKVDQILAALATPPLDNTGLDAAKDVTYVLQHNPNCPSPYLVRLCGKGTIDMKPYAVTSDRFGFGKTFGEAYAAALASGDRA